MNEEFINSFRTTSKTGNIICDLNPLTKLNLAIAIGLIAMVMRDWKYGIVACIFYYFIAAYVKKLKSFNKSFMVAFVVLGLFTVLIRLISFRNTGNVVLNVFGWHWTDAGLKSGFDMAFFILGFTGPVLLFFLITPVKDLMYSLEKKGVSPVVSYVVLVSFKTITELGKSANVILDSQKARGIETEGNIIQRIKSFIPIISPLALSAISYTEERTIAMDARAFSVKGKHTSLRELEEAKKWEKFLVIFFYILLVAVVVYKVVTILG